MIIYIQHSHTHNSRHILHNAIASLNELRCDKMMRCDALSHTPLVLSLSLCSQKSYHSKVTALPAREITEKLFLTAWLCLGSYNQRMRRISFIALFISLFLSLSLSLSLVLSRSSNCSVCSLLCNNTVRWWLFWREWVCAWGVRSSAKTTHSRWYDTLVPLPS